MSKAKPRLFACPECGRSFSTEWGMDEHRARLHGVERSIYAPVAMGPFSCQVCKRNLRNAVSLGMHMRGVHPAARPPIGRRPQVTETDATCLECGGEGQMVSGKAIYPHRPDLYGKHYYLCPCGAYCGCHPGSIVPLGHPCGPETRRARSAAHAAFDPMWRGGKMSRPAAYAWLAQVLGIDPAHCHIGMMTAELARKVVETVYNRRIDMAIDRMAEEGKVVRDGDQVTLTPEYHLDLIAKRSETMQ